MSARRLPWKGWQEWLELKANLWSRDDDRITAALCKVNDWSLVCVLPWELEVTAELFKAEQCSNSDSNIKEALYAIPIIRLTAAVRDHEEELSLRPGCILPLSIGLARNSYVHDQKPTLEHLQQAAQEAIDFVRTNYWEYVEYELLSEKDVVKMVQETILCPVDNMDDEGHGFQNAVARLDKMGVDGDRLHKLLLEYVEPPSATEVSRFECFQNGLLRLSDHYGQLWLMYLAESFLEKCEYQETVTSILTPSSKMQTWGVIVSDGLEGTSVDLPVDERDRIIQKSIDIARILVTEVSTDDGQMEAVRNILTSIKRIFHWMTQKLQHHTRAQLYTIFQFLEQQMEKQQKEVNKGVKQSTNDDSTQCGVFSRARDWESCAIGSLPFNYKLHQQDSQN